MKFIKENFLKLIWGGLAIMIMVILLYYFVVDNNKIRNHQNTIKKIESEKVELKKEVAKKEIEVKKIQAEMDNIATLKDFEIEDNRKTINKLSKQATGKQKVKIRYKTKIVYKDSPQGDLWNFGEKVHNDFFDYVKLNLKKDNENKKVIIGLKNINLKSEKIIDVQKLYIKKIKKKNKLIIAGSALAIITTILLIK